MENRSENKKKVKIVYFSGTGCAQKAALCFADCFTREGWKADLLRLKDGYIDSTEQFDLLLVVYAVYACNAPRAVKEWIAGTQAAKGIPAAVISVSGGGEVSPNTACRMRCIKGLKKKGFAVVYENMIVMPSNWIVATKEPLAALLLKVLPERTAKITSDILAGTIRKTEPKVIDRFFSWLGRFERFGAAYFGKKIKVTGVCTGCGWCAKNCPSGNIQMVSGKPAFAKKCHLCLNCLYGCPAKALSPGAIKFILIKDGFDLRKIKESLPAMEDVPALAKGYLWSGVKKYLMEWE